MTIAQKLTIDDMVRREVIYNVSALVSALVRLEPDSDDILLLCSDLEDYEEAARGAGWNVAKAGSDAWTAYKSGGDDSDEDFETGYCDTEAEAWKAACAYSGLDPYRREIFEHWIVSDWLAGKLEEQGETVVRDVHGLTVWGRTCTGQGVAMDSVIERIYAGMMAG